ncbi:hypothetical protein PS928_06848 [Pseudomonas fluorescens]|uniref:DUF2383 domain-containing protein n=2 Tax=Pseudomonas fluorescens TaxID=294 RepID=A0A5E7VWB7_PSEFL|nr:hypothetical protein PS928_06848 [Pseudomonas fluorescens]
MQRSADCATAASELQAQVRSLGGDPETSTSVSGDMHRRWVDVKAMFTGKDEEAVLNEAERGEDHALKAYKDALEKINKDNLVSIRDNVERQYHGVERNHVQVKSLRNQPRARS